MGNSGEEPVGQLLAGRGDRKPDVWDGLGGSHAGVGLEPPAQKKTTRRALAVERLFQNIVLYFNPPINKRYIWWTAGAPTKIVFRMEYIQEYVRKTQQPKTWVYPLRLWCTRPDIILRLEEKRSMQELCRAIIREFENVTDRRLTWVRSASTKDRATRFQVTFMDIFVPYPWEYDDNVSDGLKRGSQGS